MVCSWRVKTVNYKSTEEDKCQWNDKHLLMKLKQGPAFFFLSDSGGMFFFCFFFEEMWSRRQDFGPIWCHELFLWSKDRCVAAGVWWISILVRVQPINKVLERPSTAAQHTKLERQVCSIIICCQRAYKSWGRELASDSIPQFITARVTIATDNNGSRPRVWGLIDSRDSSTAASRPPAASFPFIPITEEIRYKIKETILWWMFSFLAAVPFGMNFRFVFGGQIELPTKKRKDLELGGGGKSWLSCVSS